MSYDAQFFGVGLVWYGVFLFSTTCHEAAHALVAKLGGDPTAFEGGQVSLDPRPHIRREPVGMVLVPLLAYFTAGWMLGWAATPYNRAWAARYHRRAALMSLAGPAANLLLAAFAFVAIKAGLLTGLFAIPETFSRAQLVTAPDGGLFTALAMILSTTLMLNLLLGVFNLLPAPPMDGSTGITLFMSRRMSARWQDLIRQPVAGLIGFLLAYRLFGEIFAPIGDFAVRLLFS